MDPVVTYEALCALRAAADLGARELADAWATVHRALESFVARGPMGASADKNDARQQAILQVFRSVRTLEAKTPAAAVAWLKKIYQNKLRDIVRRQRRRREILGQDRDDDRPASGVDEMAAPEPVDPRIHDPAALAPFEEALWEAVDDFVQSKRQAHRASAFANAQLAYRWWIDEAPMDALHADAEGVTRETLYQKLRRGRVDVLLPAIEAWLAGLAPDEPERAYAAGLVKLLNEADRADAGKPRPDRRKKGGPAVSPEDHWKSAQCDDPHEGDHD